MPEKVMHPNMPQHFPPKEGEKQRPTQSKTVGKTPQATEESLIYAVYKRRPLWDPAVHFYRNNTVVKLLWDEVAQETGLTDLQAKTRWKSLRDYYRIELKKLTNSSDKGPKKSGWIYFQSMSFLRDLIRNSKGQETRQSDHSEESLSASEESIEAAESLLSISANDSRIHQENQEVKNDHCCAEEGMTDGKTEIPEKNYGEQQPPRTNDIPVDTTSTEYKYEPVCGRNPLKMRPNFDMMHRKLLIQLENRRLELLERSIRMEEDDDLLFLRSLLPLVKSLPESRKIRMRIKFQEILSKELEDLNQKAN